MNVAAAENTTELRQALRHAGFSPIPVEGKIPAPKAWQQKVNCNAEEIESWSRFFPEAASTGILTRATPTIDIDILNPEAAEAIEALAQERFEERGHTPPIPPRPFEARQEGAAGRNFGFNTSSINR
jgi:hypothetical protein